MMSSLKNAVQSPFTRVLTIALFAVILNATAQAQNGAFHAGTLIPDYGKIADIPDMLPLAKDASYNISFDISKQAEIGKLNRQFVSSARFLNMHVANGVDPKNIKLAMVIHGKAVLDVTRQEFYEDKTVADNVNADLIANLIDNGVEVFVCGQSAAFQGVKSSDLLPGVKMSLSAMTAHATLQQSGYTYNPF